MGFLFRTRKNGKHNGSITINNDFSYLHIEKFDRSKTYVAIPVNTGKWHRDLLKHTITLDPTGSKNINYKMVIERDSAIYIDSFLITSKEKHPIK